MPTRHTRRAAVAASTPRSSRWALHETSVAIERPDGSQSKVAASRDGAGTYHLHPSFVTTLDRKQYRPRFAAYLDGDVRDDRALAPLLPLSIEEARTLLHRRHPPLAAVLEHCVFGEEKTQEHAEKCCKPPVARQTINERRDRAVRLLAGWTDNARELRTCELAPH
jgi:hypothetical protein